MSVATITVMELLASALSCCNCLVATWCMSIIYMHYFVFVATSHRQPSPATASALLQRSRYNLVYIPLFLVATITKPAFLCLLQHTALKLLQLVVCRLSIYMIVFLFLFFIFCCNSYRACPSPASACCNPHEARFSAQRSAVATCHTFFYIFIVATITTEPASPCLLQRSRSSSALSAQLLQLAVLFFNIFICCNNYY